MAKVGIRELKSRLSHYIGRASKGEYVVVTDHGRPVAIIVPIEEQEMMGKLRRLTSEGIATWSGGKPGGITLPVCGKGESLSQIVLEDRR